MRARPVFVHFVAAGFVAAALLPAGCGATGKDQGAVIHRRLEGEPKTLNGILVTTDPELTVLALISRNLLDYDESLALVPGLAESVEEDQAHLVYTVRLRDGVRWEDGSPVTADDVVFTLEAVTDEKVAGGNRKSLFDGFVRTEKVDQRTARVVFRTPSATRRHAFSLPLLPAARYRGTDVASNPVNRRPVANGPYRLARWDAGRTIELVRNTQYFGEKSPAEKVVFRIVPDASAAFEALGTAALDETRLTSAQYERLQRTPGDSRALLYPQLSYTYLGWNNRSPLFSDSRVRRALTLLVDRSAIARNLYGGTAAPANGGVPPGMPGYDPSIAPWPYDPAEGASLLAQAGWRKGADGVLSKGNLRFDFSLAFGAGSDVMAQVAQAVQEEYRKAGIRMDLRPAEWASFTSKVDAGEFEACFLVMSLDPNPDLFGLWHSSQNAPNGWNVVGYASRRADALMEEIRATFEPAKVLALTRDLGRVLHEEEPVSFMHNAKGKWGVARRIEDVRTSPYGLFLFWPGASSWRTLRVSAPS